MTKYKSTAQVMKIISDKNKIRNYGVFAHVDHGKDTMSESLNVPESLNPEKGLLHTRKIKEERDQGRRR